MCVPHHSCEVYTEARYMASYSWRRILMKGRLNSPAAPLPFIALPSPARFLLHQVHFVQRYCFFLGSFAGNRHSSTPFCSTSLEPSLLCSLARCASDTVLVEMRKQWPTFMRPHVLSRQYIYSLLYRPDYEDYQFEYRSRFTWCAFFSSVLYFPLSFRLKRIWFKSHCW